MGRFWRVDHVPAERDGDRLVSETDAEHRHAPAQAPHDRNRVPCVFRVDRGPGEMTTAAGGSAASASGFTMSAPTSRGMNPSAPKPCARL